MGRKGKMGRGGGEEAPPLARRCTSKGSRRHVFITVVVPKPQPPWSHLVGFVRPPHPPPSTCPFPSPHPRPLFISLLLPLSPPLSLPFLIPPLCLVSGEIREFLMSCAHTCVMLRGLASAGVMHRKREDKKGMKEEEEEQDQVKQYGE